MATGRMRLALSVAVGLALTALAPERARAQDPMRIQLEELMSEEERTITGVNHLTRVERAALEAWLTRYTATVAAVAKGMKSTPDGGRIIRNGEGGTTLRLANGTTWEVYLPDRPSTVTWAEGDLVLVRERAAPIGDYRYVLTNGDARGSAAARFAGWAEPTGKSF